jgi:hypothetical protein
MRCPQRAARCPFIMPTNSSTARWYWSATEKETAVIGGCASSVSMLSPAESVHTRIIKAHLQQDQAIKVVFGS